MSEKGIRGYVKKESKGMFNNFVVKPLGVKYITSVTSNITGLTKDSLSNALSYKKGKELLALYKNDEKVQCEYSYDQMVRKEGWSESSVKKGVRVLEIIKGIFLLSILLDVIYVVNYFTVNSISLKTFIWGFPSLALFYLLSFMLTIVSWEVYRIKHRDLITHGKFMSIALKDLWLFIPFWENQEDIDKEKQVSDETRKNIKTIKKNKTIKKEIKK